MTLPLRAALALAACLALALPGSANDDCCFDWNNTAAGTGDVVGGSTLLLAGPSRPGAPFGWAHCTGATENGPGQTNCFSRLNRQAYADNYSCVVSSPDPNGAAPLPHLPWGSGFQCVSRAEEDMATFSLQFINQITEPLGQEGLLVFEDAVPQIQAVPGLGRWGTWVLAALLCVGGALMLRRSAGAHESVA